MSTPPRRRHVKFYRTENDSPVAKEEFLALDEAGQAALYELFRRFERGLERRREIDSVRDGLMEFRVQVAGNQYRAYYFSDGPLHVIVALCTVKKQRKASKQDIGTALDRMKAWKDRGAHSRGS